jgi:hypothetical protein
MGKISLRGRLIASWTDQPVRVSATGFRNVTAAVGSVVMTASPILLKVTCSKSRSCWSAASKRLRAVMSLKRMATVRAAVPGQEAEDTSSVPPERCEGVPSVDLCGVRRTTAGTASGGDSQSQVVASSSANKWGPSDGLKEVAAVSHVVLSLSERGAARPARLLRDPRVSPVSGSAAAPPRCQPQSDRRHCETVSTSRDGIRRPDTADRADRQTPTVYARGKLRG